MAHGILGAMEFAISGAHGSLGALGFCFPSILSILNILSIPSRACPQYWLCIQELKTYGAVCIVKIMEYKNVDT